MKLSPENDAVIAEARVLENRPLAADTGLMVLDCPEAARAARPGRFVKIRAWAPLEEGGGPLLDRPFSIHRAEGDRLSLLYRVVGPATRLLRRVPAGGSVRVSGPLGRGLDEALAGSVPAEGLYLAAGGIGLAPMALARDWLGAGRPAVLFYGERTGPAQVEEAWLKSWAGDFIATVEDGSGYGRPGLVTAPLAEALAREVRPIFACGPTPMLAAVSELGWRFGAPVLASVEAGMACGFGVCLTCSLPLTGGGRFRVCQEGPVVDGLTVDWGRVRG